MDSSRYFDHAATTPLDSRVLEEMLPYLREDFGNANSIHSFGARADAGVARARERVAELIGADDPSQIVFTSGATEANNWVISAFDTGAVSPFEHSAVREPAIRRGFEVLPNVGLELGSPQREAGLISVMSVNNEIGSRWNAAGLASPGTLIHSDMTQQVGKLPIVLDGIDFASMSAHKLYGPKGIGALYFASQPPEIFMAGGEQEHGWRAGTLNVPGIVGFGAAAAIARDEMDGDLLHAENLRGIVLEALEHLPDWRINGGNEASPYILSISFLGLQGETLVVEADQAGYAISAGAACSSRSTEPSHVLTALKIGPEWLQGTVRISFGRSNTPDSARELARTLLRISQKLRRM